MFNIKYFYCEECKSINSAMVACILSSSDPSVFHDGQFYCKCHKCGKIATEIDAGIISTIRNLNMAYVFTEFSCEGHIAIDKDTGKVLEYNDAYILFHVATEIQEFERLIKVYPLPDGWETDHEHDTGRPCIRFKKLDNALTNITIEEFLDIKHDYLYAIEKWSRDVLNGYLRGDE